MSVVIDGGPLALADVVSVARDGAAVEVAESVPQRMEPAHEYVRDVVAAGETVYGVTTGFGALSNTPIGPDDTAVLQVSLVRSHAAGVGEPLPTELVRSMMLLRARTLAQGHSGVRPVLVQRFVEFLNLGIHPVVPAQGSVGASGDLAPFAHLALALIGEGTVDAGSGPEPAAAALQRHGLEPLSLEAKEGLSLLNGTEGMLSYGVLGLFRADRISVAADIACALSIEALMGSARPFRPELHELRPHPGQLTTASNIAAMLAGSAIGASHADDFVHAVQDAYSLRCAPQVHGAARDVMDHAAGVFEREVGSVVDNPIVFADRGEVISGGNFHGQPLAFALDFMTIAITELCNISERRTDRILDPERSSGLPPFLSPRPGVNSGYMLTQYTAAALVAENRILSHPASVESIPTSGSQEDHVSMGWGAGRKLWDVLSNAERVLAVEVLCAVQGIEYRVPLEASAAMQAVVDVVRSRVPPLGDDRVLADEIEEVADMVRNGDLAEAVIGAGMELR